ncbi:Cof-type HAD-IIB family hydrolase [Streptococcus sp. S784/96/1]|uniref:Cof-type HAD-IIB family hydrolase n=1 Tax=Streptococcus sp. S784/96/1 TaxID=2653499 RepID=UPI0013873750|nr:Cof-type HAD-IIB family hydrolase [Streptococcus sp. S784/96/1]
MIKLIAIDMDGTLLDHNKKIPEDNIIAIRKAAEAGIKVVICTGRMQSGVIPYFEQLDFAGHDEYAILNNGCSVHHTSDWSLHSYSELLREDVALLAKASADYPGVYLTFADQINYTVLENVVPDLVAYDAGLVFTEAKPVNLGTVFDNRPIFQAMYLAEKSVLDIFQAEQAELLSKTFSTVRSQSYIFEAMPKGVTKANALAKLSADLGYSPEEVMAIGDADNDLEMLAFAGVSVAMGNATETVKSIAKYETSSCDEAGVARAIETYALKK